MQLGIWMLAFVAIAVWSLIAWAGDGLLDWTTDWAADNADKVCRPQGQIERHHTVEEITHADRPDTQWRGSAPSA